MLSISRKVIRHAKIPINLKGVSPSPVKTSLISVAKNYVILHQKASAVSAVSYNNHDMNGRQRSGNSSRFDGAGYGGRGDYDSYGSGGYSSNNGMNSYGNMSSNMSGNDLMQIMSAMASGFNMNPPPPPPMLMCCGDLRAHHAGLFVELSGRLIKKRVTRFMELRDRGNSACQLVILEDRYPRVARRLINMPENTMLSIVGLVTRRPRNSCNQTMPTGEIEVEVQDILNVDFKSNFKRAGDKRSYSTMAEQNRTAITSTEYKIAKSENLLKYFENRDITCNDLRRHDIGKVVTLVGWVPIGKMNKFMQMKDGYGQTQIVIEDQSMQDTVTSAPEGTVVQITGKVVGRPRQNINMKYNTGEIEVIVDTVKVLNPEDPYDGPIKDKNKVKKLSITDMDESDKTKPKNGEAMDDDDDGNVKSSGSENILKVADRNKFANRTHTCGELSSDNIGQKVTICGWLEFQRMSKFFVLRDAYGQTQVLLVDKTTGLEDEEQGIALESIVKVEGTVIPRPAATINPKMKTGYIEVEADIVEILNPAKKNLPFEVRKFNRAGERLRLTHRYIDLRFSDMQHNLRLRSQVIMRMREYLINYLGFVEVETPTLFRRTPGGAQEFVVPTRKPGQFYSLVQSPQQFKQMLMAGAIDRYFQVARCYRDEATRPDRQPEFTQLDIELSFTNRDDIMQLIEETIRYSWPKEYTKFKASFDRVTYNDAMEKYGTDKPDTRFNLTLTNVTEIIRKNDNFQDLDAYAIIVRGNKGIWNGVARKRYDALSKKFSGTLFVHKFLKHKDVMDRLSKLLTADVASELISKYGIVENDILFLGIGEKVKTQQLLGKIRLDYHNFLIENDKTRKSYNNRFVWVTDFPMFERNPETGNFESVHHPFTAPHPDDMDDFINSTPEGLLKIRSQAYDLVLNGQEVGGGSIRIHDRDMQHFVLEQILKVPHDHLGHLLRALESGCPPHGGIALGLDRLIAIICRAVSIRDVIAFPKSLNGHDPLSSAPVEISEEEKALYHLSILEDHSDEEEAHGQDTDPDAERPPPSPSAMDEEQPTATDEELLVDVTDPVEAPEKKSPQKEEQLKPKRVVKKSQ